jgi:hypothetical protein
LVRLLDLIDDYVRPDGRQFAGAWIAAAAATLRKLLQTVACREKSNRHAGSGLPIIEGDIRPNFLEIA